jgi:hypothetical protein
MAMVCPQCRTAFENNLTCPRCNVRLVHQAARPSELEGLAGEEKWHQTLGGRAFAGVIFSLGLCYGLLQATAGLLHVLGWGVAEGRTPLAAETSLTLFYLLQVPGVVAGAMLAGAGRRKAIALGALVGLITGTIIVCGLYCGALSTVTAPYSNPWLFPPEGVRPGKFLGVAMTFWTMLAIAPLHLLAGTIGGVVTRLIWTPPPELAAPVLLPSEPGQVLGMQRKFRLPTLNPYQAKDKTSIGWFQVILGVVFAIGVVYYRDDIMRFIQIASDRAIRFDNAFQRQLVSGLIVGLGIFFGGAIAGVGRANGFTQGIMVGVAGGMGQIAFLQYQLAGEGSIFHALLGAIFLAPLGGYFGCSLLPPAPPPTGVSRD